MELDSIMRTEHGTPTLQALVQSMLHCIITQTFLVIDKADGMGHYHHSPSLCVPNNLTENTPMTTIYINVDRCAMYTTNNNNNFIFLPHMLRLMSAQLQTK